MKFLQTTFRTWKLWKWMVGGGGGDQNVGTRVYFSSEKRNENPLSSEFGNSFGRAEKLIASMLVLTSVKKITMS